MNRTTDLVELKKDLALLVKDTELEGLTIDGPGQTDRETLHDLFAAVIQKNFEVEGLEDEVEAIEGLIEGKKGLLEDVLAGRRVEGSFYLFRWKGEIIATIDWGPPGHLIRELAPGRFENTLEIGTVFILPAFQRVGIGRVMMDLAERHLLRCGRKDFVLDSGYGAAQVYWRRRYGEPTLSIPDYWGEEAPHEIWHVKINEKRSETNG